MGSIIQVIRPPLCPAYQTVQKPFRKRCFWCECLSPWLQCIYMMFGKRSLEFDIPIWKNYGVAHSNVYKEILSKQILWLDITGKNVLGFGVPKQTWLKQLQMQIPSQEEPAVSRVHGCRPWDFLKGQKRQCVVFSSTELTAIVTARTNKFWH